MLFFLFFSLLLFASCFFCLGNTHDWMRQNNGLASTATQIFPMRIWFTSNIIINVIWQMLVGWPIAEDRSIAGLPDIYGSERERGRKRISEMFCIFLHFCNERIDRIMKSFIFFPYILRVSWVKMTKKNWVKLWVDRLLLTFLTHTQRTAQQLAVTTCYAHF